MARAPGSTRAAARRPVKLVGAALLVLGLPEKRQDRIIVPALAAALAPAVVIGRRAAHVDHAVDRAGAAQHLAARLVERAAVELRLGLALEHPVHARVGVGLGVAERDMDPRVAVDPAGFEQQHPVASRFAEPRRDRTARRAGAGDDEVENLCLACHDPPLACRDLRVPHDDRQRQGDREGRRPISLRQGPGPDGIAGHNRARNNPVRLTFVACQV